MAMIAIAAVAVVAGVYAATRTQKVPGQKLGDIAVQTAKEGEPRLIVYGVVRPVGGNLIAVQEPPRIQKKKVKSGGKGGGGSSQTVEVPRRTYAVGICEGPITGIRRVWRNNKLVYDGRGTAWGRRNNATFLKTFTFYLGGWDQMPDPSLQSVFGAANVPPHRGTAYMVAKDEDLQDTGGAVPQWLFEVVRAEGYALTSRPYPVEDESGIAAVASSQGWYFSEQPQVADGASVSAAVESITIETAAAYLTAAADDSLSVAAGVDSVTVETVAGYLTTGAADGLSASASVVSVTIETVAGYASITILPESAAVTAGVDSITVETVT